MPRLPISYVRSSQKGIKKESFRRPTPDPFARSPQIREFLRQPTWSVKSLLPDPDPSSSATARQQDPSITPKQLNHLLRLSALPQPKDAAEESSMLQTLETQLHFVREIQKVDTTGVEPLVSLRDETPEAREENTVTLASVQGQLDAEEKVGKNGRVRRVARNDNEVAKAESWDLFKMAEGKTLGRFFVVRKQKDGRVKRGEAHSQP